MTVPVIIGVGEVGDAPSVSPVALMAAAARAALADAGVAGGAIDSVSVVRLFSDSAARYASPFGRAENPPEAVAADIGATATTDQVYGPVGGTSPIGLLRRLCARIQEGSSRLGLIVGGEAMRTAQAAIRRGVALDWSRPATRALEEWGGTGVVPNTAVERQHGLLTPLDFYPLLETAFRGTLGRGVAEHRRALGLLMAGFAGIAAGNPLAARAFAPEAVLDGDYLSFPYTSRMVAQANVDQAAALLVTSEEHARSLGIPPARLIYPRAIVEAREHWFVSERREIGRAPALAAAGARALDQCGITIGEVAHLDVYSCFPAAIQIACRELGLAPARWATATVTGGLPYFGGPGNNYVTHALARLVRRLRGDPGAWALATGVSYYMSKHAVAMLSGWPPREPMDWHADDAVAAAEAPLAVDPAPAGEGRVETYTVTRSRDGGRRGIVIGRMAATGTRFVANVADDAALLDRMTQDDMLGVAGTVVPTSGGNLFAAPGWGAGLKVG